MRKDCYNLFAGMKDLELTCGDICRLHDGINLYSLTPLADSILGKGFLKKKLAANQNRDYRELLSYEEKLIVSLSRHYLGIDLSPGCIMDSLLSAEPVNVNEKWLMQHSLRTCDKVLIGDVLEKFVEYKSLICRIWEGLAVETKKDFALDFWLNYDRTQHIDLSEKNYFLVHSVNDLSGQYYRNFLEGIPVSCSVFDIRDPWYCKPENMMPMMLERLLYWGIHVPS